MAHHPNHLPLRVHQISCRPSPRQLQGPKNCEQHPRGNNEIREAVVYGIFSRNILHSYLIIRCLFYWLLTLKPVSEAEGCIFYDIHMIATTSQQHKHLSFFFSIP